LVKQVLGEPLPLDELQMLGGRERLNMTLLALNLSRYVNGVAKRHGVIAQHMFPGYAIDSITNGVHSLTWTSSPFRRLFDQYIPGWSRDPFSLRYAIKIPPDEIWAAHVEAKTILLADVERRTGKNLPADVFTIGFARRATAWKRPDLVLRDPARLRAIVGQAGPVQFLFAGKAHPQDEQGKEAIRHIVRLAADLEGAIRVVYLEDYDLELARLLTSGVDLWLNTPLRPFEASGTSGMKAAHNGVPSLSILDGWWIDGHLEGVTGWAIGAEQTSDAPESEVEGTRDAEDLYDKLARVILPLYYTDRSGWIAVMQRAVALNASFFNTHRMVQQYAANAYL
jgi:starch phosphorylase